MIGTILDHYRIVEKLGEGGMGVVYKAHDTHLDRFVAIKTLPPGSVAAPDRMRRFTQEAKAASALNHPNIVTIYDISQAQSIDYIAMEYVPGKTFDELIPADGMRLSLALKYAVQIADALARAHGAGIVHRDLKPSNLMVDEHGQVKILDFGLAKLIETGTPGENASTQAVEDRTEKGALVGTLAYMSPEQAEVRPVDARSDIFSFGSVLYEMLTGQQTFRGETRASTIASILRDEPKPVSVSKKIPGDLEKLISRCLRKDPARRWQTMADLRVALTDIRDESDTGQAASVPHAHRQRWLWPAIISAALALGAAGAWFTLVRHGPDELPLRVIPLSTYPGSETDPAFSPDGNQVAFAWDGGTGSGSDIYVKQIGEETALRLTRDPARDISPAWSPDGRFIAFTRLLPGKACYYSVPAIGGPERKLGETQDPEAIMSGTADLPRPLEAWSADGQWLFLSEKPSPAEPFSLVLLNVESGEKRRLTWPEHQQFGDAGPAYSPEAHALVFVRTVTYGVSDLYLLSLSTDLMPQGAPRRLTFSSLWSTSPVWMRHGRAILFSSGPVSWAGGIRGLWQVDPRSGALERVPVAGEQSITSVTVSPRRNRLAYAYQLSDANVWRVPLGPVSGTVPETEAVKVIASTYTDHNAQYSPDGNRIVFISSRSGSLEVWMSNSDGSEQVQLTHMSAPITGSPRWSPDGERIVFDSNVEGHFEIYTIGRNGGKPIRLTNPPADNAVASWSHGGHWIYFTSNRSGTWQIWKMRPDGGEAVQLTREGGRVSFESPDGKLVFYAKRMRQTDLWEVPVQAGTETRVLGGIDWQQFSVAGDGIYFISRPDREGASFIEFQSFAGRESRAVAKIHGPLSFGLSVSPDGRSALITKVDQQGSDLMLVENFR